MAQKKAGKFPFEKLFFTGIAIITLIFLFYPTWYFYKAIGVEVFFPAYTFSCSVMALVSLFVFYKLYFLKTKAKYLVLFFFILLLVVSQIVLLVVFTPFFDYLIFRTSTYLMCSRNIDFYKKYEISTAAGQFTTACHKLYQLFPFGQTPPR